MISNVIQILMASLGSLGFAIIFKMKRRHLAAAAIGGGATWVVYLICAHFNLNTFFSNLIATIFASIYSEVMRRICKTPRTVFVIPTVVPLIPGSSLYYMMSSIVSSDVALAEHYGIQTALTAGAIAFGILLFKVLYHVIKVLERKILKKKQS